MKKRILTIALCLTMVLTTGSFAFAAEDAKAPTTEPATEVISDDIELPDVIGKTITVEGNVNVYEEADAESASYNVWGIFGPYTFVIEEVLADAEGNIWYRYDCSDGAAAGFKDSYPYVKAGDVTIDGITPDEPQEDEVNIPYVDFNGSASNGMEVKVLAPEGAFPEGTSMTVSEDNVSVSEVKEVIDENILGIISADISFSGTNPLNDVIVTVNVPADKIPEGANKVIIIHMGSNGPEVVGSKYLDTSDEGEVISFSTDSFSSYVAVFVNGKYHSEKMSSILQDNDRYEISTFPVDLFDYEPAAINSTLNAATDDNKGFHFTGYQVAGCTSNNGINNSDSTHAKQGILENTLSGGLPVIKYLNGTDAGKTTGKILFDDSYAAEGKTIYRDIPFEFIYDKTTGYYEYKSSTNHAQLNEDQNKIELYADTLSTENVYVDTIDLSTAAGPSDLKSITKSTNSFKATAADTTGNDRIDPYAIFTVDNVSAATVGRIYVKAKVPANVGKNKFQLFFITDKSKSWTEAKSFGSTEGNNKIIPYTANGDWIEFVVDTSENPDWKDTITAIRVDLFDSNKGTLDVTKEYPIEISEIRLIKKNVDQYTTRGGFYPFSEIEDSYPGNNTAFNMTTWETNFLQDNHTTAIASRSIFNPTPSSEAVRHNELAYGLVSEFDFYLPVDKMGMGDKPLTYYFDGDDDLWVFVDGKLALDIGGGHGAITGSINFTEGTWKVNSANTVTGYNAGANGTYGSKSGSLPADIHTPGKHTMKIFYLERGGSVSNCFMKFNLPRTPQGSVRVNKSVVKENNGTALEIDNVLSNEKYTFNIKVTDRGDAGATPDRNFADEEFFITGTDGNSSAVRTDANGNFELKHGEVATFTINENFEVTVTETTKNIEGYENTGTTVNGANSNTATLVTAEGKTKEFAFVNKYDEKEVTITYKAVNPMDCPDAVKGTVKLTGTDAPAKEVSETIGERVGVPAGSTATDTDAVKFVGWYADEDCTVLLSEDEAFMPSKDTDTKLWESTTYYAKFEYMYGDIKINKKGISSVDNHPKLGEDNEETQSTIFNVKGTSNSNVSIDMDVAICGNDFVVIKQIPVGTYVVKEIVDWPWRYTPADSSFEVIVTDEATSTVTFNNNRNNIYWLNGGAYKQNLFN